MAHADWGLTGSRALPDGLNLLFLRCPLGAKDPGFCAECPEAIPEDCPERTRAYDEYIVGCDLSQNRIACREEVFARCPCGQPPTPARLAAYAAYRARREREARAGAWREAMRQEYGEEEEGVSVSDLQLPPR